MKANRLSLTIAGILLVASAGAMAGPGDHARHHDHSRQAPQAHKDVRYDTRHMAPPHARGHGPRVQPPAARRHDRHVSQHRWQRGDRIPASYRSSRHIVRDWHGHGLRRPARGHEWVSVGRDYLLIATATGLIAQAVLVR